VRTTSWKEMLATCPRKPRRWKAPDVAERESDQAVTDFVLALWGWSNGDPQLRSRTRCVGTKMSTILVVDDDPSNRSLLRVILEMEGHEVVEAADGEEALGIIRPDPLPDIVVTDLTMPILNGVQLVERLQSEPRTAPIPIVVVSGDYDLARGLETSGLVEAVVRKPIDVHALAECIRAIASSPMRFARVT
jgi:CheY-like chemotaxis protein